MPLCQRTVTSASAAFQSTTAGWEEASRTVMPAAARPLHRLANAIKRRQVECYVAHRKTDHEPSALAPGIQALSVEDLLHRIG